MTVHISLDRVAPAVKRGIGTPLYQGQPIIAASLATSGTAASTTTLAAAVSSNNDEDIVARIVAVDAAHYVRVGGTASATNGHYVPSGSWIEVAWKPGQEVSAVTA